MASASWSLPLYEDMFQVTLLILHAWQTNEPFLWGKLVVNCQYKHHTLWLYAPPVGTQAANTPPEVRGAQMDHRWFIGLQK